MHEILQSVFHFFGIIQRQTSLRFRIFKILKINFKFSYINEFLGVPCCRQKHTVSLDENAQFHSPCSPKNQNVISSLNMLYTVEKAKFYFTFLHKTHCFISRFGKNAQFHSTFLPKTINMIKKLAVTKTMLSVIARFWQQR